MPNMFLILGAIMAGIGFVLLGGAAFAYVRTRRFLATAVTVQGVVFDLIASHSSEGGTTYKPAIRFGRLDGGVGEFIGSIGSSPPRYAVGQVVGVKYDPMDPRNARIDTAANIWLLAGVLAAVGIGLFIFGLVFVVVGLSPGAVT